MSGPGSPSIQNVIAMDNLGTPATAAFVPSLITTAAMFIMIFVWLEMRARKFTKKGYRFIDKSLKYQLSEEEMAIDEDKNLPHVAIAVLPIVLILVLFNIVKLPVETSVFAGVALATILMFNRSRASTNGSTYLTKVLLTPALLS